MSTFSLEKLNYVLDDFLAHKKTWDKDKYLHQIVEFIAESLGIYFVGIYLIDESKKYVVLKAGSGIVGESLLRHQHTLEIEEKRTNLSDHAGTAAYHEEIKLVDWLANKTSSYKISVNGISETNSGDMSSLLFKSPIIAESRTELYLPLQVENITIGILELTFNKQAFLNENEIEILQSLTNEVAVLIKDNL